MYVWRCTGDGQAGEGNGKPAAVSVKLNPWPTANLPDGGANARKAKGPAGDAKQLQVCASACCPHRGLTDWFRLSLRSDLAAERGASSHGYADVTALGQTVIQLRQPHGVGGFLVAGPSRKTACKARELRLAHKHHTSARSLPTCAMEQGSLQQQQPSAAARQKPAAAEPAPLRRPGVKRPMAQRVAPPQQQQGSKRPRDEPDDDGYECASMPALSLVGQPSVLTAHCCRMPWVGAHTW